MKRFNWFALLLVLASGCVGRRQQWIELPAPPPEVPAVNLPASMRPHNWTDSRGSGSCVIASSVYHFRWLNRPEIADFFRRTYAGGQTATSIEQKWRAAGIPFVSTGDDTAGDPEFLEWASVTRRGAIIWYFDNHCVHFCGYAVLNGQEYAVLNDNNREDKYIRIPKMEFLKKWRGYGGFACTALLPPAPSIPFRGYALSR